jgi:hypothetical protein
LLIGILYAALGAFTFALNNVAMRRGVVTGSVLQGMAMTVPIGGLSFLLMTRMGVNAGNRQPKFPICTNPDLRRRSVDRAVLRLKGMRESLPF